MTTRIVAAAPGRRAHRPVSRAVAALAALLALWVLCCAALTSTAAASTTGPSCAGGASAGVKCSTTAPRPYTDGGEAEVSAEEAAEIEREVEEAEAAEGAEAAEVGPETAASGSLAPRSNSSSPVVLSDLRVSAKARAALKRPLPSASTVGFSFTLSAPATLRVTLARQTSLHGSTRWATLADSLTLSAARGRVHLSLRGHNRLSSGRYRLTVAPAAGRARSIYLSVRR